MRHAIDYAWRRFARILAVGAAVSALWLCWLWWRC